MSFKNQGNEAEVQAHFKPQAKHFSNGRLTLNNADYLRWILESFELHRQMQVLDVAAGTGIVSRAFAPFVAKVTAVDLTEAMIQEGRKQLDLLGITNVDYVRGHAEQLPVGTGAFDIVVSRLAFHHFTRPDRVLREMARACGSDGRIGIIDMISPDDPALCRAYNHYERLRDPSHTEALTHAQLLALSEEAGIEVTHAETIAVPVHVGNWLRMTNCGEAAVEQIRGALQGEMASGVPVTGMFPYRSDTGEDMFMQTWIKLIGRKRNHGRQETI